MKTSPIQLQNYPARLYFRPFYPNTLFTIDSVSNLGFGLRHGLRTLQGLNLVSKAMIS